MVNSRLVPLTSLRLILFAKVHQCVECPPKDLLREDDRPLASVQPHHPFCGGGYLYFQNLTLLPWQRSYCKRTLNTCAGSLRTLRQSTTTVENAKSTSFWWTGSRLKWSLPPPKLLIWSKWGQAEKRDIGKIKFLIMWRTSISEYPLRQNCWSAFLIRESINLPNLHEKVSFQIIGYQMYGIYAHR